MLKKLIIAISMFLILSTSASFAAPDFQETEDLVEQEDERGVVEHAEMNPERSEEFGQGTQVQEVRIRVTTGELSGEVVEVDNILMGNPMYDMEVEAGDRMIIGIEATEDGVGEVFIKEYVRDTYLYGMIAVFLILLVLIGRLKGLKSVITLALTIFLVVQVLIPGILRGYSPILLAVLISGVVTFTTIFIISGVNIKSISAIIGIIGGILIAGVITLWVGSQMQLTGFSSQEAMMLLYIPQDVELNIRGLLFAGIIIGSLGAVMDVGISIASAMQEVKLANPEIKPRALINSGFNVGRDIMGTMSNTLILAYTGSAIPLLILFTAYNASIVEVINMDIIATEVVRALAGSIGLIMTVPITVFAGTFLFERYK